MKEVSRRLKQKQLAATLRVERENQPKRTKAEAYAQLAETLHMLPSFQTK